MVDVCPKIDRNSGKSAMKIGWGRDICLTRLLLSAVISRHPHAARTIQQPGRFLIDTPLSRDWPPAGNSFGVGHTSDEGLSGGLNQSYFALRLDRNDHVTILPFTSTTAHQSSQFSLLKKIS